MRAPAQPVAIKEINVTSGFAVEGSSVSLSNLASSLVAQNIKIGADARSIRADASAGGFVTDGLSLHTPAGNIDAALNFKNPQQGTATLSTAKPLNLGAIAPIVAPFAPMVQNLQGAVGLNLSAEAREGGGAAQLQHHGQITLRDIGLSVAPFDVNRISGDLRIKGDKNHHELSSDSVKLAVNDQMLDIAVASAFDVAAAHATLARLTVKGFGGELGATADTTLGNGGALRATVDARNLSVASMLSVLKNPSLSAVQGTIAKVDAKIATVNGPLMMGKLAGTASFDVRDGSIPGVNLIGPVLKAVASIPLLTGRGKVPPAAQSAADSPNTAFQVVSGTFQIADGVARTNDIKLVSALFNLNASGTMSTAGEVALNASIFLEPGLSAAVTGGEAKKLLNAEGRLEVPLSISGKPGAYSVSPDISRLMQTAAGAAIKESASKLLDKAFGGGKKGGKGGLFGF